MLADQFYATTPAIKNYDFSFCTSEVFITDFPLGDKTTFEHFNKFPRECNQPIQRATHANFNTMLNSRIQSSFHCSPKDVGPRILRPRKQGSPRTPFPPIPIAMLIRQRTRVIFFFGWSRPQHCIGGEGGMMGKDDPNFVSRPGFKFL